MGAVCLGGHDQLIAIWREADLPRRIQEGRRNRHGTESQRASGIVDRVEATTDDAVALHASAAGRIQDVDKVIVAGKADRERASGSQYLALPERHTVDLERSKWTRCPRSPDEQFVIGIVDQRALGCQWIDGGSLDVSALTAGRICCSQRQRAVAARR